MFCPKCGKEVVDSHEFCIGCGSSIGSTQLVEDVPVKPKKPLNKKAIVISVIALIVIITSVTFTILLKLTPDQKLFVTNSLKVEYAQKQKETEIIALVAVNALKTRLKDPDSLKLKKILIKETEYWTNFTIEYSASNSYGGNVHNIYYTAVNNKALFATNCDIDEYTEYNDKYYEKQYRECTAMEKTIGVARITQNIK